MIDYEYREGIVVSAPETRFTPNEGRVCCVLRLGQADHRKDETGNFQRVRNHYFTVKIWPLHYETCDTPLPSLVADTVRKGDKVVVRGKFETRSYVDKRGDDRQVTEFVANAVYLNVASPSLDGARAGAGGDGDNAPWE